MFKKLFLLITCCCAASMYATIGYRLGQSLNRATTPVTKRLGALWNPGSAAEREAAQQATSRRVAQLGAETRMQQLSRGYVTPVKSAEPMAPQRDIRSSYAERLRKRAGETASQRMAMPTKQTWTAGEVSQKWANENPAKTSALLGVGAGTVGYVQAKTKIKAPKPKVRSGNQELWETVGMKGMVPAWFTVEGFDKSKVMLPAGTKNEEIYQYMLKREKTRQMIQVNAKIKALPAAEQKTWKARFKLVQRRYPDTMPLENWKRAQREKEESAAVRMLSEGEKPSLKERLFNR